MSVGQDTQSPGALLIDEEPPRATQRIGDFDAFLRRGTGGVEAGAGACGGVVLGLLCGRSLSGIVIATVLFACAWWAVRALGRIDGDDTRPWRSGISELRVTVVLGIVISWPTFAVVSLLHLRDPALGALGAVACAGVASTCGRSLLRSIVSRNAHLAQRTLIIGSGVVATRLAERFKLAPRSSLKLVGLLDDDPLGDASPLLPHLGVLDDLDSVLRHHDVDRVIIAFTRSGHADLLSCIRTCCENHVAIDIVPRLFELLNGARTLDHVGGLPLISIVVPRLSTWAHLLKRGLDLSVSGVILLVLLPVFAVIAVVIKLDSPGPVIFRQQRVGRNGRQFAIYKFRSMRSDADGQKVTLANLNDARDGVLFKMRVDPRVTRSGRILRRFSLDEFPQFFNVLTGEMSIVGPRPLLRAEIDGFSEDWHARRLDLRPGITGPWQIYGRSELPFDDMVRFDYQYVTGWSLGRDIEIMLSTLPALLAGRGAY